MPTRRTFLTATAITLVGAAALIGRAHAQAARLEEADPVATALGYKHDATKVDKSRYPRYAPDQVCANCTLYRGKVADAWAPCAAVGGKQVAGKGWCNAWVKRPE